MAVEFQKEVSNF